MILTERLSFANVVSVATGKSGKSFLKEIITLPAGLDKAILAPVLSLDLIKGIIILALPSITEGLNANSSAYYFLNNTGDFSAALFISWRINSLMDKIMPNKNDLHRKIKLAVGMAVTCSSVIAAESFIPIGTSDGSDIPAGIFGAICYLGMHRITHKNEYQIVGIGRGGEN